MIDIIIRFPDKHPNGEDITPSQVEDWFKGMSKAVMNFTGIKLEVISVTPVIKDEENG